MLLTNLSVKTRLLVLLSIVWTPGIGAPLPPASAAPSNHSFILAQTADNKSCLTECQRVFTMCQTLCRDVTARDRSQYGDNPDVPVDQCLKDCQEDYKICQQSCS